MTQPLSNTDPELLVVVDTEEEFDWRAPFSRSNVSTRSVPAQARAQAIYDRHGIVPTYVIGYPVATDPVAVEYLHRLKEEGRAQIGAHLHPWVTPPHREDVNTRNSYQCNLPPALEAAKIAALTEAIAAAFGDSPTIFKAGRHGFGPATARAIAALGYKIDCSLLPHSDLRGDGGPDFRGARDEPYWLPDAPGILEVPATTGFFGHVSGLGRMLPSLFDSPVALRLRLPGLLGRTHLVGRSRLTPEGVSAAEQCRLIEAMIRQGRRTFSLVYHSPSLVPGNTPYVRTQSDLARFLEAIEAVLAYFRDVIGGRFTTLAGVHARMSGALEPSPERPPQPAAGAKADASVQALRSRSGSGNDQPAASAGRA